MKYTILALSLCLAALTACNQKKSDVDLFAEGKLRVNLSVDRITGYAPLTVNYIGYLENEERQIEEEITEVLWEIRGPGGYERDVKNESQNFQDEDDNKRDTFYYSHTYSRPGTYRVRLFLNDGKFVSKEISVQVLESVNQRQRY